MELGATAVRRFATMTELPELNTSFATLPSDIHEQR